MPYYLYEISPLLLLLQGAFTVWMLTDANRRGLNQQWYWMILCFQPFGAWAYFFTHKTKDFHSGNSPGWWASLFHRRPSLQEVRYRAEQSPTVANRFELGERLIETGEFAEALPHVAAMLAREPEHSEALFLAVQAHRGLGQFPQAVERLQKLLARQPNWRDYEALRTLVRLCQEANDFPAALKHCRELVRIAPRLEHRCLLAERLLEVGEGSEARRILEQGLIDFRFLSGAARRRDGRWVGKARQLLKQAG